MSTKPKLHPSGYISDWFVIEPLPFSAGQPEGNSEEWRAIAEAMKARKSCHFNRCAVSFNAAGDAHFCSPRNSQRDDEATVPAAEVDAWAIHALAVIEAYKESTQ